jgi:hypothetical protein
MSKLTFFEFNILLYYNIITTFVIINTLKKLL